MAEFPHVDPTSLFDFWISPDLLSKWWPPVAELEPRVGESYHFSWPKQDWHLRGRYILFKKGEKLGFTWKWDHGNVNETRVTVSLVSLPNDGTRLSLDHEGYTKIRDEHVEGWMFFLGKLQGIV